MLAKRKGAPAPIVALNANSLTDERPVVRNWRREFVIFLIGVLVGAVVSCSYWAARLAADLPLLHDRR